MNENPLEITLIHAETPPQLAACLAVRRAVFTVERGIPAAIEQDEHDCLEAGYDHFLARVGQEEAAALRCHREGGNVVLQRFCVLAAFRRHGVGRAVLAQLERQYAGQADRLVLDAKCEAEGFYTACGYRTVSGVFEEAGVKHVRMEKLL